MGLLAVGYANAQEYDGKVGINTNEPKATLDITPETNNLNGTTNEGIIAPRLTKTRIANIEANKLTEGTLVYATDAVYTAGADTAKNNRVAKIDEKGYYFYNGTEWVKVQYKDTDTNSELWAQRDNNGITETYLKPADENSDDYLYSKNRSYIRLGNIDTNLTAADGFVYTDVKNNTPHSLLLNANALPTKENAIGPFGRYYPIFSREYYTIDNSYKPTTTEAPKFRGKDVWMQVKGITMPISYMIGQNIMTDFQSSTTASAVKSLRTFATVGDIEGNSSPTVTELAGGENQAFVYSGKSTNLMGQINYVGVYGGAADNIYGENTTLITSLKLPTKASNPFPTLNIKNIVGNRIWITNKENTTAERAFGVQATTVFEKSSAITHEASGVLSASSIQTGSNVKSFAGFTSSIDATGAATVENLYAFRSINALNAAFQPTNMYGIHLADVNKGTNANYAIYTNAGKVRVGDLADATATGNRQVVVDADGVLKIGAASATNTGVKATTTAETCSDTNLGAIHFKEVEISGTNPIQKKGVFGFCTKQNNTAMWVYLSNGGNIMQGTGTFGQGL